MSTQEGTGIRALQAWIVGYMHTPASELNDEPETELLSALLQEVDQSHIFKVIYSTRGVQDWTVLHYAVRNMHGDVVSTFLSSLNREDRVRALHTAPVTHSFKLPNIFVLLLTFILSLITFCDSEHKLLRNVAVMFLFMYWMDATISAEDLRDHISGSGIAEILYYVGITALTLRILRVVDANNTDKDIYIYIYPWHWQFLSDLCGLLRSERPYSN